MALCTLLEFGGEPLRLALRYEVEGPLWRWISGHFVHLGWIHLGLNAASTCLVYALFGAEMRAWHWWGTALLGALMISAALYWQYPQVSWYVGSSGVLHGFFMAGLLLGWRRDPGLLSIAAVVFFAKLAWESQQPFGSSHTAELVGGAVITPAHVYGTLAGAAVALPSLLIRAMRAKETE